MIITKGEKPKIQNQLRVPHVFQVFPELSNRVISNMNIILYNIHGNINCDAILLIFKIHLSKKIDEIHSICGDLEYFQHIFPL